MDYKQYKEYYKQKYRSLTPDDKQSYIRKQKEWQKEHRSHYLWLIHKNSVKRKNRESIFTEELYIKFIWQPCTYCGTTPAEGVDRVDTKIGYTQENSVPCCGFCNRAKQVKSLEEFEEWLDRLVKFRAEKKFSHA